VFGLVLIVKLQAIQINIQIFLDVPSALKITQQVTKAVLYTRISNTPKNQTQKLTL
jgi:hypothetical protein